MALYPGLQESIKPTCSILHFMIVATDDEEVAV